MKHSPIRVNVVERIKVRNKSATALIMHTHMLRLEAKNAQNNQANGCKFVTNVKPKLGSADANTDRPSVT